MALPYTNEAAIGIDSSLKKNVIFNSSLGTVLDTFGKTDCIVGAYSTLAERKVFQTFRLKSK